LGVLGWGLAFSAGAGRLSAATAGSSFASAESSGRGAGKSVFLDGAPEGGGNGGELVVSEVDRRHGLTGPSLTEVPGDDQSIIASPQTEVASGRSINDDEQRDEPERPENILDHCRTPNRNAAASVRSRLRSAITWLRNG
jgi:hypothetical protein